MGREAGDGTCTRTPNLEGSCAAVEHYARIEDLGGTCTHYDGGCSSALIYFGFQIELSMPDSNQRLLR